MTRLYIPGAWFAEAWPSGAYIALRPGYGVESHVGLIPIPDRERAAGGRGPWFPRMTMVGGFQIAGQSHAGLGTWHWRHSEWRLLHTVAHGVSPVIFDRHGALHIADASVGSQGFRYVDGAGRIVTGDATYADPSRAIWEYTTHGDLTIGQGAIGCHALAPHGRYLLEDGHTTFVRFAREGDQCAVAMTKPDGCVLLWFTVSDLTRFPRVADAPPQEPDPMPEMSIPLPPRVRELLIRFAAVFPPPHTPGGGVAHEDRCRRWTRQFVEQVAFSEGPSFGHKRSAGEPSKDAIAQRVGDRLRGWDILIGAGTGAPKIDPDTISHDITGQTFIPVEPVNHLGGNAPAPEPTPVPPPPTCTCAAELARLQARVSLLEQERLDGARIALQTANGNYLCAEGGGGGDINATRTQVGAWEEFRVRVQR